MSFIFYDDRNAFNPAMLPSLQAWYDLTSPQYLTLSTTAITQALDRSGNNNHTAVQGTTTARPTFTTNQVNGLPAAVFDGGDTLAMPSAIYTLPTGSSTIFVVSKRATVSGAVENIVSLAIVAAGTNREYLRYAATDQVDGQNNIAGVPVSQAATTTNWNILRFRRSGTTQAVSVNNAAETTNTSATNEAGVDSAMIGSRLGTGQFLTGTLAELLIYNRPLSSTEYTQVSRYLSGKYAITIS